MRKLVLGILGATALSVASAANATEFCDGIDSFILNLAQTETFGCVVVGQTSVADSFLFYLGADYDANATVTSLALKRLDIDFTSIYLDSVANSFTQTQWDPLTETWSLDPTFLAAGWHTIYVNGNLVGTTKNGSYQGNINLTAVPEPATWAMMFLGFGAIGWQLRRRRTQMIAQAA